MERTERDRAVSTIIGAVFLLGLLVILLSIYQATLIPNQNKQVEFDHSQTVENDMVELRNAILEAKSSGDTTFAEVSLGTGYPARIIGINPPSASGSLRTGPAETIEITDKNGDSVTSVCPSSDSIETRTLKYTPDYAEYREAPTLVYENTVLYMNFSGDNILLTDEQLIANKINISPLNTSFSDQGVDTISVEPIPGQIKEKSYEDATITLPTELSESDWEELLEEDVDPSQVTKTNGKVEIQTSGKFSISCSPTGLNEAPAGGQREDEDLSINPAGPNDVELEGINQVNKNRVDVTFNNTGQRDTNITEARLSFYFNRQAASGDVPPLDMIDPDTNTVSLTLRELEGLEELDPEITLAGNGTKTTIRFDRTGSDSFDEKDFFVVKFRFQNGKTGTYFIDVPKK